MRVYCGGVTTTIVPARESQTDHAGRSLISSPEAGAYRYGCGALVDTSAPIEVVEPDPERGIQREHVYRCSGCGVEIVRLDGRPMTGDVRHGELISKETAGK